MQRTPTFGLNPKFKPGVFYCVLNLRKKTFPQDSQDLPIRLASSYILQTVFFHFLCPFSRKAFLPFIVSSDRFLFFFFLFLALLWYPMISQANLLLFFNAGQYRFYGIHMVFLSGDVIGTFGERKSRGVAKI